MAIRKIVSRSIQDATVAAADFGGSVSSLSVSGASALTTLTSNTLNINAISTTLAVSANKVFVYDTRKDSDGGAWRKRTQMTSWYNETLNTGTRGSRREFPAVAVIVLLSTSTVTIYDGDDPTLPMWMVFNIDTGANGTTVVNSNSITTPKALFHQASVSAITCLNGLLVTTATNYQTTQFNFVSDSIKVNVIYGTYSAGGTALYTNPISGRNSAGTYNRILSNPLPQAGVNDVAITVLPNAPIDAATALPIPTIAIATNAGIAVIHNTEYVNTINATDATEYNYWRSVGFTKDYKLIINGTYAGSDNNIVHVCDIPYVNFSGSVVNTRITALNSRYYHSDSSIPNLTPGQSLVRTASTGINALALGGSTGLNLVAEAPETLSAISSAAMVAGIQPTYNTGWMVGDIKGAFLSDTTAETVTSADLITNGTFGSSSNWSVTGGWAISAGVATRTGSAASNLSQTVSITSGKTYIVTFTITNISGTANLQPTFDGNDSAGQITSNGTYGLQMVAGGARTSLLFYVSGNGNITIDNVTLRLADVDRSVRNLSLAYFGTIAKAAVATGADLVGYSGYSASNYLMKPIDSTITGSTSRFFATWLKYSDTTTYQYLMSIGNRTGGVWGVAVNITNGTLYTYDATNQNQNSSTSSLADNQWHFVCVVDTGKSKQMYVDGTLVQSVVSSAYSIPSDSNYYIGVYSSSASLEYTFTGSLALQRFGITLPSRAQIAKMYNDEKYLFLENAKATLYGGSSVITNLAYDDSTDLLHVGTSAGRSVFDGLRRVDNTTTAVSQSISASNGLVVEQ